MKSLQFLSLLHIVAHSTITLQTDSKSTPSHDTRCYYDPFYHLRLDAPPICSLSPKSGNADPTPDILSFEEWKAARQIAAEPMQKPHSDPDNALQHPNKSISDDDERTAPSVLDGAQSPGEDSAGGNAVQGTKDERVRVPLTDRLNYASQDCTARVHSSHKGGKSPSAILSSKKDRYMLSPCNYKNKFVVVELCDDVRIDTVQLANYEFFSGVFKDVKISLADSAPGDPLSWVDAGTYRAKNIRGVQSFHPQQGRQKFWRYIRIDFLSHYGNEYFCPVSLLRVYGLTHMEDYKWVGWQIEKEAPTVPQLVKMEEVVISATAQPEDNPTTVPLDVPSQLSSTKTWPFASSQHMAGFATMPHTAFSSNAHSAQIVLPLTSAAPSTTEGAIEAIRHGDEADFDGRPENPVDAPSAPLLDSSLKVEHSRRGLATQPGQERTGDSGDGPGNSLTSTISATPSASDALPARPSLLSSSASHSLPSSAVATPPTASIHTGGGESIYRMIMNRLHVLEINSTLGIRYVEEQTRSLRDVVRKLEEDVGRLDELEKRQQRLFERTVLEIEKQRRESDMEIRKLAADVQTLAREVTLEKRLGFLQLCLLICAFIFMGLTRGSRDQTFASQAPSENIRRVGGSWSRGRTRNESYDGPLHQERRQSSSGPKTSSRSHVSFHHKSAADPFATTAPSNAGGLSSSYRFPPSHTHAPHTSLSRLNRHGRQRVISSPSLPIKFRHSSPRRIAPHLHEVKPSEPSRRRFQIDLGEDPDDDGGTPRARRISPPQGHVIPFPLGSAEATGESQVGREERETSPSSTAAGDDISSDEGGVWEDTSTEDEDEESLSQDVSDEPGSQRPSRPSPVSIQCESNQSAETLRLGQM